MDEVQVNPEYVEAALQAVACYGAVMKQTHGTSPKLRSLDQYVEFGLEFTDIADLISSLLHLSQCLKNAGLQTMDPEHIRDRAWNNFYCEVLDPDDIELDQREMRKKNGT